MPKPGTIWGGSTESQRPCPVRRPIAGEILEERRLLSATPELLADLSGKDPATYFDAAVVGDQFYFTAGGPAGEELWKSDGTAEGTRLVKDINPGSSSSSPRRLVNVNGTLFFTADDGVHDRELWTSDGTEAGTRLVKDISPFAAIPETTYLASVSANVNGQLVFWANDGVRGQELWKSDGTAEGTVLLRELRSGSAGALRGSFVAAGNFTYFTTSVNGLHALWRTDGSIQGTVRMDQMNSSQERIRSPVAVDGTLFFKVIATGGSSLWTSDGTSAGTHAIAPFPSDQLSQGDLFAFNGDVYFAARTLESGSELFKYDVSVGEFVLVAGISGAEGLSPGGFSVVGDTLFFTAWDGIHGNELWRTDGTTAGTQLVRDIRPGTNVGSNPQQLVNFNGTLLFVANDGVTGGDTGELWKSDGTAEGTELLKDVNPWQAGVDINASGVMGDRYYFVDRSNPSGLALWSSDGTTPGTELVAVVVSSSTFDLSPSSYLRIDGFTYLGATTGLWRIGDDEPLLITPHSVLGMVEVDGRLFFKMRIGFGGFHVASTDGTPEGTRILHSALTNAYDPFYLTEFGSRLYFTDHQNLWTSDGTVEGTVLIHEQAYSTYPRAESLTNVNGTLLYTAGPNSNGRNSQLWASDGTTEGTRRVDIAGLEYPAQLVSSGGRTYFTTKRSGAGIHLWVSDGTLAGTQILRHIGPDTISNSPVSLESFAGRAYFVVSYTNQAQRQIWTSDGTEAGTYLVQTVVLPSAPGNPNFTEIEAVGDTIYYSLNDGVHGTELWWSTIGEPAANLFLDLRTTGSSSPSDLTNVRGVLYFTADSGGGRQLWQSDGTLEGTSPVLNWPGAMGADPRRLANVAGSLLFVADAETGRDPWIIPGPQIVGRQLFYNNSAFDGDSAGAEAADDGAIATDKIPYLPGSGLSTTASVSSYSRGINGVMIDIANAEDDVLTADDFTFRIGTGNSPESWILAPAPLEVIVRAGAGVGGSDRVTITWADGAIKNTWLQVVVEGNDAAGGFNANTGLAESDVFYFGSRVGDTFVNALPAAAVTSAADELGARFNPGINQPVTNVFDFNRDGVVSAADQLIARSNGGLLMMLALTESLAEATALPTPAIDEISTGAPTADDAHWWLAFALAASELEEELSAGNLR